MPILLIDLSRWTRRLSTVLVALLLLGAVPVRAVGYSQLTQDPVDVDHLAQEVAVIVSDPVLVFPQDAEVTRWDDTFGYRRDNGRRHEGNDLMAPKMSPVYAIADGVVTIMRKGPKSGYWLALEHAGEMESWYMHLNNDAPGTDNGRASIDQVYAPGLQVGDFVAAGQLIGFVGDSGNAEYTGAHTHFELRIGGRLVDPYDLLTEAAQRAILAAEAVRYYEITSVAD